MTSRKTPFVSVITPTYNRVQYIPRLVSCYKSQTYPKESMEWIVLDDGQELCKEVLEQQTHDLPNIRYIQLDSKLNIGEKRNLLNKEARGDIIICMDDDDYYPPERVEYAVNQFLRFPSIQLAGSTELFIYYTDTQEIYKLGPYNKNHATNGTMAYRKEYAKSHTYDEMVTFAEEKSFLEEYKNPMIQLEPKKVMLVMSHSDNTFDKDNIRKKESQFVKKTSLTLRDFIKDSSLRSQFEVS
jgi:glycosyltransferase involved in cell wall biosynthesis